MKLIYDHNEMLSLAALGLKVGDNDPAKILGTDDYVVKFNLDDAGCIDGLVVLEQSEDKPEREAQL